MVRLDEDEQAKIVGYVIVISALAFGFVAGIQFEGAVTGEPIEIPILVATGGGFLTAISAWLANRT